MPVTPAERDKFKRFIEGQSILIVDASATTRSYVARTLIQLGAKTQDINLSGSVEAAREILTEKKPSIIISDFSIGKVSALELFEKQKKIHNDARKRLFVLVTGNSSQSAVAQAAEEEVDTFILKPITADVFTQSVVRAALQKAEPSPYSLAIQEARGMIEAGQLDAADAKLRAALKLNPRPALALGYLGQVEMIKNLPADAEGKYRQGLNLNRIHYKCMVGLFDTLQTQKRYMDAYQVVKRISQYFPANPQRLTQVLKLAIQTKSYDDVESYYLTFKNIDERNDEMVRYVCAALVVVARYYLQRAVKVRAVELLQSAVATSAAAPRMLKEIIALLCEFHHATSAKDFLKRFRPEHQSGIEYAVCELLIMEQLDPPSRTIAAGKAMLAKEFFDPTIYKILIRCSAQAGLRNAAEDFAHHAGSKFPDHKKAFEELSRTPPKEPEKKATEKKPSDEQAPTAKTEKK